MKTLITLCFCLFSTLAFAVDSLPTSPTMPTHPAIGTGQPVDTDVNADKTLLANRLSKAQGQAMKAKFQEHGQEIKTACHTEMAKFCPDAKAPREIFQCLGTHASELGTDCRTALPRK